MQFGISFAFETGKSRKEESTDEFGALRHELEHEGVHAVRIEQQALQRDVWIPHASCLHLGHKCQGEHDRV